MPPHRRMLDFAFIQKRFTFSLKRPASVGGQQSAFHAPKPSRKGLRGTPGARQKRDPRCPSPRWAACAVNRLEGRERFGRWPIIALPEWVGIYPSPSDRYPIVTTDVFGRCDQCSSPISPSNWLSQTSPTGVLLMPSPPRLWSPAVARSGQWSSGHLPSRASLRVPPRASTSGRSSRPMVLMPGASSRRTVLS